VVYGDNPCKGDVESHARVALVVDNDGGPLTFIWVVLIEICLAQDARVGLDAPGRRIRPPHLLCVGPVVPPELYTEAREVRLHPLVALLGGAGYVDPDYLGVLLHRRAGLGRDVRRRDLGGRDAVAATAVTARRKGEG